MSRRYLRLPEVLDRIPVSKSTWWAGIRNGIFPKAIKLSPRVTVWLEADIDKVGVSDNNEQASEYMKLNEITSWGLFWGYVSH